MVLGKKPSAEDIKRAQKPMCRLCRLFWIGIYMYNGKEVGITEHSYSVKEGRCFMRFEIIKEASSEAI